MSKKRKVSASVLSQRTLAPEIYDLWLATELAAEAKAGQFIGVYPTDRAHLLPRPISICEVDRERGALRIVYRIAGAGTAEFSSWQPGQEVLLLGVLGNGFPVEEVLSEDTEGSMCKDIRKASNGTVSRDTDGRALDGTGGESAIRTGRKKVVLMGGGIGIPPMLELARELGEMNALAGSRAADALQRPGAEERAAEAIKAAGTADVTIIVGYRDSQLFLKEDLEKYGRVLIATEDGSAGIKGNVLTVMEEEQAEADVIMACGPMPMLRAVKAYAGERGIPAYISLEERMACGVGACLGCVCKTTHKDAHSHVNNARICTEGPVFKAEEVDI